MGNQNGVVHACAAAKDVGTLLLDEARFSVVCCVGEMFSFFSITISIYSLFVCLFVRVS